jgi:tRNA pseudouridine13 synthase
LRRYHSSSCFELGGSIVTWRLRARPEDFVVDEVPLFAPSGEGGHTFVRIEKRLRTTEEVARLLARAADVSPRDVGYAGRKDRVAVTRQWFSVPGLLPETARALDIEGMRVLDAIPHGHKLRTGALRGNRFELRVTDVPGALLESAAGRLAGLVERGMPNRFGAQRFGRDGDNAERARKLLEPGARVRDRRQARFLLSALQAAVFNEVLARRSGHEGELLAGDVAVVCASGGLFVVEDLSVEQPRADAFEISPTGPIFGTRVVQPEAAAAELESLALAEWGVPGPAELQPPRGVRLRGARRPLRIRPAEARCERVGDAALALGFTLPAGCYATVLVEELLGPAAEPTDSGSADPLPSGEYAAFRGGRE